MKDNNLRLIPNNTPDVSNGMKTDILGLQIDSLSQEEVLKKIDLFLSEPKNHLIITANPELCLNCLNRPELMRLVNSADLVTADGAGLIWAAEFLKKRPLPLAFSLWQAYFSLVKLLFNKKAKNVITEKITGVDLVEKICRAAAAKNQAVYLLGGRGEVSALAAKNLQKSLPHLTVFNSPGPQNLSLAEASEISREKDKINRSQAVVLIASFGAPTQEQWLKENLKDLPNIRLAIGTGGTLDFISGKIKRAPLAWQKLDLEWLWRVLIEPWRMKRIFNATFKFIIRVIVLKNIYKKHFKS